MRLTTADAGLADSMSRPHRSTAFDFPHQSPDFPQDTADLVDRSPGTTFTPMRKYLTGSPDEPQQPPELPERVADQPSPNRRITDPNPRHHLSGLRQALRGGP